MEIERLGPYKIVGKLGRGGMGTVYEGVHTDTGEAAAVKLLSPDLAQEEGFRNRFEAEIETLRKLNHPNIVRLIGFGQQDVHLFYSMELVDGNSLEEELRRGRRFDWREVIQLGIQTCRALRHAHDRGIIHRDIKPANLLLAPNGIVKLSDFGIARLYGYSRLTNVGNVVGTAEYMAPEQASGQPVDARSDLYSVGALLYALLARRPVFRGKSLLEVLQKQRYEQPEPLRNFAADVPEELERILAQLLEKDPAKRFPNADLLGRRLDALLHASEISSETIDANADWFDDPDAPLASDSPTLLPTLEVLEVEPTLDFPGGSLPPTQLVSAATSRQPSPTAEAIAIQSSDASPPSSPTSPPPQPTTINHFTHVGEHELDPPAPDIEKPPMVSWQTAALASALLLIGAAVWWSLQPPSADSLFARVQSRMDAPGTPPSTRSDIDDVRATIDKYLNEYPNDPNAALARRWDKELGLRRLQCDFEQRINSRHSRLTPVEQMYLEAIGQMRLNPTRAVTSLQSLIDLYENTNDCDKATEQCLSAARLRLAQLRQEVTRLAESQLTILQKRLTAADAMQSKNRYESQKIYRAVIELYSDKPWAAEAVAHARKSLKKPTTPP